MHVARTFCAWALRVHLREGARLRSYVRRHVHVCALPGARARACMCARADRESGLVCGACGSASVRAPVRACKCVCACRIIVGVGA
eukprot:6190828-Pleurochrysis_carterae.AAC.1